jgi:putative Mg2+ transporter-C (MgtC) family protein
MLPLSTILYRLLWAALMGSIIGIERIRSKRPAGLRTSLFVCLGAALFTIVSAEYAKLTGDTGSTRIASNIVQGIGFLGAGVILREKGSVVGLTTAATIFVEAAIGMAAGAGLYRVSGFTCLTVFFALVGLGQLEKFLNLKSRFILFRVTTADATPLMPELHRLFDDMRLPVEHVHVSLAGDQHVLQFDADVNGRQQEKIAATFAKPGFVFEMLPADRRAD